MKLTRRKFLMDGGKMVLAASSFPHLAFSQSPDELHLKIAKKVRDVWGNKNKKLTLLYPKGSLANLKPVASSFTKLTGVLVELREAALDNVASELLVDGLLKPGNGDPIDIALPATMSLPDLVEAGAVKDLTPFAREHEPIGLWESSLYDLGDRYKGNLYGYQSDGDTYMMFYNKEWLEDSKAKSNYFDLYGEELGAPKTWKQLDRQMKLFHDPKNNRFGGSIFRTKIYSAWEFWLRFHAKGLFPVDDNFVPQFNNEAGVEALAEMVEATKHLSESVFEDGLFENFDSYLQGNKFCNFGWGGTQKAMVRSNPSYAKKLGYSSLPGGEFDGKVFPMSYFNWGWNYVVSSRSTMSELAYLFCLFASTPVVSTTSVREKDGFFDPFRSEHYNDKVIQEIYTKDFLYAHKKSLITSMPDFYVKGHGRYFSTLRDALQAALKSQVSPKLALKKVSQKWERITDELGRKEQVKQWSFIKNSYPSGLARVLK